MHYHQKSEKQNFKCADCDKTFFSQRRLLKHVQALHLSKEKQDLIAENNEKTMTVSKTSQNDLFSKDLEANMDLGESETKDKHEWTDWIIKCI